MREDKKRAVSEMKRVELMLINFPRIKTKRKHRKIEKTEMKRANLLNFFCVFFFLFPFVVIFNVVLFWSFNVHRISCIIYASKPHFFLSFLQYFIIQIENLLQRELKASSLFCNQMQIRQKKSFFIVCTMYNGIKRK